MQSVPQPPTSVRSLWIASPPGHLLWSEAGADHVLFHRPSGKTHFVNHATFLLLNEVLRAPKDLVRAASDLAHAQGAAGDVNFQQEVAALLRRLEELGLVERA